MNTNSNEMFSELFKEDSENDKEIIGVTTLHLDFMDQIEEILTKKGYTKYKDLADILGVKRPFVSQLRSGDKFLNLKMLYKIQKALGFRFRLTTNDKNLNGVKNRNQIVINLQSPAKVNKHYSVHSGFVREISSETRVLTTRSFATIPSKNG